MLPGRPWVAACAVPWSAVLPMVDGCVVTPAPKAHVRPLEQILIMVAGTGRAADTAKGCGVLEMENK